MKRLLIVCAVAGFLLPSCKDEEPKWESLFNGEDLTGWTIKITGYPLGENFGDTYRVEDGILKVRYDQYDDTFGGRFGHLYTDKDYSHYKFRCEYRFVGQQVSDGPGWALRNSGAMLHCPAPETMHLDQDFPVSIETQFLGGDGVNERSTGNLCTPGTHVFIDNKKYTDHVANSNSKTFHGEQWVKMEIEVYGDSLVRHVVNGDTVMTYTNLMHGGGAVNPKPSYVEGTPIGKGRIALQAESHPVDFRSIEIMDLSSKFEKE